MNARREPALSEIVALILAGGLGTRLQAVVPDRPKAMADVAGQPFLAHQLAFLRHQGIRQVVLLTGHRHQQLRQHFGDGRSWGLRIDYMVEEAPLGTAGALRHAAAWATQRFLALNGDSFLQLNLAELLAAHAAHRADDGLCLGTLALARVPDARAYGQVGLDAAGRISSFAEKTDRPEPGLVNAGLYVFEPALLDRIPPGRPVSLERETLPGVLAVGGHLYGHPTAGYFVDIGTPAGYRAFRRWVAETRPLASVEEGP